MSSFSSLVLGAWVLINIVDSVKKLNVAFLWFDDLGFGDVGYNGAEYPTPILDELANNDAIKINYHYTEQICSASRSSLLTGRYSWLTQMNNRVIENTKEGYNTNLTLLPQLLDANNFDNFIAGKWHIGYANDADLAHNRGFKNGLYSHQAIDYYLRGFPYTIEDYDEIFGAPNETIQALRNEYVGNSSKLIFLHDTYQINNYIETPTLQLDTSYNEDLYTQAVKSFIAGQDGKDPFFLYYSLWTPHSFIIQPPEIRPDGSKMDYNVCYDSFNMTNETCIVNGAATRCVFCKQMLYAQQNIEEIIEEIKANDNIKWEDTIVIITSDNGANQGGGRRGPKYGSPLPFRGRKAGAHEGGVRTPAMIKGGYIENMLKKNKNLINNKCEYNELFHVSDWYHLFMDLLKINKDYQPDSDHSELRLWDNMECNCQDKSQCDNKYPPREEVITMRLCGDPKGSYQDGDKYFYSAFIRKGDYKLVVNGTNRVGDFCADFPDITEGETRFSYLENDGTAHLTPNQEYFDDLYSPRFNRIDASLAENLFKSECLDALAGTDQINIENLTEFEYANMLLYNVATDKIEACAIDDDIKKQELLDILDERSKEYEASETQNTLLGSLRAQMESYDCDVVYTKPWNGDDDGNLDEIWLNFIIKQMECDGVNNNPDPVLYQKQAIDDNDYIKSEGIVNDDNSVSLNNFQVIGIIIVSCFGLLLIGVIIWHIMKQRILKKELSNIVDNISSPYGATTTDQI